MIALDLIKKKTKLKQRINKPNKDLFCSMYEMINLFPNLNVNMYNQKLTFNYQASSNRIGCSANSAYSSPVEDT